MTTNENRTIVERHYGEPPPAPGDVPIEASRTVITSHPTAIEMLRRLAIVGFGLVQLAIVLRILLLLIDAREAAPVVAWIIDISGTLIAPFDGILRHDSLRASGSVLDLTAVAAFVGWTIAEAVVLAILGVFGRDA